MNNNIYSSTHYRESLAALGVDFDSDLDIIKKSYRKLAMKHHPDRNGDAEEFKRIKEAYEYIEKWFGKSSKMDDDFKYGAYTDYEYSKYKDYDDIEEEKLNVNFTFKTSGNVDEVASSFFNSYFSQINKVLKEDNVSQYIEDFVGGFANFLNSFEFKKVQLGVLQVKFLEHAWGQQSVEVLDYCSRIHLFMSDHYKSNETINVIDPNISHLKPALMKNGFFILDSILDNKNPPEKFLKRVLGGRTLEELEESAEKYLNMIGDSEPYLEKILQQKYASEIINGLSDLNALNLGHRRYKDNNINPYYEIISADIKFGDKLKNLFLKDLGIDGVVTLATKAHKEFRGFDLKGFVSSFEKELLEVGAYKDLPESALTKNMQIFNKSREDYQSAKEGISKFSFTKFMDLTVSFFAKNGVDNVVETLFSAVEEKNMSKFKNALKKVKDNSLNIEDIRFKNIPLATYVLFDNVHNKKDEHFTLQLLDVLKDAEPNFLKIKDEFGNSAEDWLKHMKITTERNKYKI